MLGVDFGCSAGGSSLVSIHTIATTVCISVYSSRGSFGSLERETGHNAKSEYVADRWAKGPSAEDD